MVSGRVSVCAACDAAFIRARASRAQTVYVPSDRDKATTLKRAKALGMLQVPFDAAADLKRQMKVWAGSEVMSFGLMRRSGVPALVVLDAEGEEMAFLEAERRGPQALKEWPADARGEW